MGYQPNVYKDGGGDNLEVASGGTITVASGGSVDVESGGAVTVAAGGAITVADGAALNSPAVGKTADFVLTAADSGGTYIIGAADKVASLPATAIGLKYTFVVLVIGGSTGFSISPTADDKINAKADNADLVNTQATSALGDSVTLVGDGVAGWLTTSVVGTWA